MEEIFRDIEGYEGSYQISNFGNVKSLAREVLNSRKILKKVRSRVMKPSPSKWGYLGVPLRKDIKAKTTYLHRLVAETFIPNPENKPQVNHIDGVRTNNRIDNLEWVTNKENSDHAYATGRIKNGINHYAVKLTNEQALLVKYNYPNISNFKIGLVFGISQSMVSKIRLGKAWKHI